MDAPKQPLSIEQAGNYLAEKKETMAKDMKKIAKEAPVSLAPPEDRHNFLMYGLSFLNDISETAKNKWCEISGKAPGLYSTKEVARILRQVLSLRINGYSVKSIAHHLKIAESAIENTERLAVQVVGEAIQRSTAGRIPLVG